MKINHLGPSGINPYKRQINKQDTAAVSAGTKADKVEISSTAKELQQVSVQRQQKVEALKIQVENGTYKLDASETAKGIINFYKNK